MSTPPNPPFVSGAMLLALAHPRAHFVQQKNFLLVLRALGWYWKSIDDPFRIEHYRGPFP